MPTLFWTGFQCRRLKLRKSRWPPRAFGNNSGLSPRGPQLIERLKRDRLQRDGASAQSRLSLLDTSVRVGPANLDDSGGTIDVALFECEQLRGSKAGRGREHDHRPEHRPQPLGHRADLRPRTERSLLPAAPARIRHSSLGRVVVDELPGNRPIQHLPERLGRLEAVPIRNGQAPRTDLLPARARQCALHPARRSPSRAASGASQP
jgi:hypothetical protein